MNLEAYVHNLKLVSDQVNRAEVGVILRELDRLLKLNVTGHVVEFGCYEGTTSVHIAKWLEGSERKLYLYDSFEGLPEKTDHDASPAGLQFKAGELLASKKVLLRNLRQAHVPMPVIKKGWFSDILPSDVPDKIAFAFLDGDYYESIKTPLELIEHCMQPGSTVVIDDYANEALPGAAKAVDEWVKKRGYAVTVEASLAIVHIPL